jgi:GTP diphosphokinase / guanosine-3',5'-bis(diphosphate) 3'-diphosphatase
MLFPLRFGGKTTTLRVMNNAVIIKAAYFAAEKHRYQKRKGDDFSPYINHPLQVALILSEIGGVDDPEILAAAFLHDTVEDTETTPKELEKEFGPRVRDLVMEVTDDKNLPKQVRKQQQIDHAPGKTEGAALIKLADKISNITDVTTTPPKGWSMKRKREYLKWGEKVVKNLPRVNEALEKYFYEVLEAGKTEVGER